MSFRTLAVASMGFIVGVSLLILGVPRAINAVLTIPTEQVLEKLFSEEEVTIEQLSIAIAYQKRALFWAESARNWIDRSVVEMELSLREEDEERSHKSIADAQSSLRVGLALGPADTFAWARLAYVSFQMLEAPAAVVSMLKMSVLTAPYQPQLLFFRLHLCFKVWSHFTVDDRFLIYQQARLAWRIDPKRLVRLARREGKIELIRSALSFLPNEEARLEALLKELPVQIEAN